MSTVEEDDSHRMRPQPSVPHPQLQQQQQLSSGGSGSSMNWEPMRQRLVGSSDLLVCLAAANELLALLETVPLSEFPLMLSALLPSFSSVLTSKTKPVADLSSIEHQLRTVVLEWMGKLLLVRPQGGTEVLRPHAPHLVAVAMDVLTRDYEENAVAASRLLFDLYKTYRSLPTDCVQPYLDYVTALYRALPLSVQRNFSQPLLLPPVAMLPTTTATPTVVPIPETSATAPSVQSVVVPGQPEVEHDEDPDAMETDRLEVSTKTEPMDEARTTKLPEALASTENAETASALPTAESEATEMSTLPEASTTTSVPLASSLSVTSITSLQQPSPPILLKSNASFRVLTECPLVIMLMFQLYPQFMKANIPVLIKVMMEALALRPPTLQSVAGVGSTTSKIDSSLKRLYFSRTRELVAAQAKTLSFLTYLLRTFATELKPYEDRLATNVVALMTTCPRESIATRKELLVATRHLLNSEFRSGFYRHIDSMLDERLLMGTTSTSHSSSHRPDPTIIRPLACTTLSDFVQHVRTLLTMTQMSKVVCFFSRILHDVSLTLPLTTQYTAVRTLLSVIDLIFHNKDPDPQLGRDMLVRMLDTLVDKLQALAEYFPDVLEAERKRDARDSDTRNVFESPFSEDDAKLKHDWLLLNNNHHHHNPPDSVRDVQSMIRAIIVGLKTIIYYICTYRAQRVELTSKDGSPTTTTSCEQALFMPPAGSNEEVYSAMLKVTSTEITIIDRYIVTAMSAMKLLVESGTREGGDKGALTIAPPLGRPSTGEKSLSEQYRDALTYFAAAFTALDGYNLRRSLGRRMDVLIDAIVENPMVMIVPRHLLGSNATTSYEFCSILLDYLVERMDLLCYPRCLDVIFIDEQRDHDISEQQYVRERLHAVSQLPAEGDERVKQRSTTMLQLFERVLKSLSVYPENEAMVRRHLRRIVVVCLRSSMENIDNWPEIYCMLLRYVFRSISAGKFEDSYRELLPLIPSVLNGLYCVICSVEDDTALRSTAIELCLTIPARLSSLLPHMNLLLRVIIPALDSTSGDLVNLGYVAARFLIRSMFCSEHRSFF